jgi:hypothetical protein
MVFRATKQLAGVLLARSLTGFVVAGALVLTTTAAAVALPAGSAAAAGTGTADAASLYKEAIATTHGWSVHYVSTSTQSNKTLLETGDAGPASGSQTVTMAQGSISIFVIGGLSYVKGNASGLESLVGMSASQADQTAGQWIEFSTDNAAFSQVVAGVRSTDLARELALKGPLSLARTRTLGGRAVEAIKGTQTFGHTTDHVVLYVRAHGTHVPVEEDSIDAKGARTAAEHVTYSNWGEQVRPRAPLASVSIGPVSAV